MDCRKTRYGQNGKTIEKYKTKKNNEKAKKTHRNQE